MIKVDAVAKSKVRGEYFAELRLIYKGTRSMRKQPF